MQWHDWNDAAFDRARERNCPVLLFLRTSWCQWCRDMEKNALSDERVQAILTDRFVCIQVDKDERHDIDERYRKGGWPTLAFLDADGEILASANYLEAEELLAYLELVGQHFPESPESIRAGLEDAPKSKTPAPEPAGARRRRSTTLSMELVEDVLETLLESADPVHGGWGTRHKFPHPEALHFLLVRWSQTGDRETLGTVMRTLRHMQEGEIFDHVEGGFYRYATQPDWSVPNHGKMLDSNAQRLQAYVEAYQAIGEESLRETAGGIIDWMVSTLLDPETRAFKGSQDADPEYAHLATLEARQKHGAPECDPTVFCNWNAMAVSSLMKSSMVLDGDRYRLQALETLDFLLDNLWSEREGMYHYWDGARNLPGMLTDQAYTLRALVDAMHYAGENKYLEPAIALAKGTIERLRADDGSFYDRRKASGGRSELQVRNRSILENAVMAEALLRLSHLAREPELAIEARKTLASFLQDYKRYGHFVAGYGRAVDLLFHEPVCITIVGPKVADQTRALRKAALQSYVASRIVQTIDPSVDAELLARSGLPAPHEDTARAFIHRGQESYAETSKPERLPALMTRSERSN